MESLAYAAEAQQGGGPFGPLGGMFVPLILMFVVFYFLLIRPQSKKQRQHQEMLKSLKKGDKVITTGGLYGVVVKVSDKDVIVEVAEKVNLRFTLGAIATVREREEVGKRAEE
ncbi:MAG: preprotein translocase subunit YajC [Candidatus Abyssobacteria bacterium SURF_17]|uniref:Sec translocon accessory complex subunit YajC n=1 Tax=Candidatus Abyssobacteria bacterium SURF_17 TaxID=2093361 RepID=A0A419F618_9BACT|nr:MAG: preprotein translocase subunit YajC [Candidatus Abyssubacteria bacterium SURF_17]